MKFPKLFDKQPKITKDTLDELEARDLIVPFKTLHSSRRRVTGVRNPSAGDVVGYLRLADQLKKGRISQNVARMLLAIEATREKGPRESHINRLILVAFADDRAGVLEKIKAFSNAK